MAMSLSSARDSGPPAQLLSPTVLSSGNVGWADLPASRVETLNPQEEWGGAPQQAPGRRGASPDIPVCVS